MCKREPAGCLLTGFAEAFRRHKLQPTAVARPKLVDRSAVKPSQRNNPIPGRLTPNRGWGILTSDRNPATKHCGCGSTYSFYFRRRRRNISAPASNPLVNIRRDEGSGTVPVLPPNSVFPAVMVDAAGTPAQPTDQRWNAIFRPPQVGWSARTVRTAASVWPGQRWGVWCGRCDWLSRPLAPAIRYRASVR